MVLRGGANVYPAEVEAAVSECPGVRSCVVVGLPDPELGQRVHAIIEPEGDADGQAIADGMAEFLKDRLSRYKHPKSSRLSAPRRAMIPEKSAARCCATSAQRG
ncbi:AMP-binding enzyme C-terminal domain-containing protein [Bradyrhizobium shewense]|uniref:AMP-binding enzyme C-terminal domain-containing protein n=1 Tax=Bradyrhizobium shewense TaxID=1761772 RepID=A0A1C3WVD0_9BRAD|nr:AMP-binding enzyme C-terminal domain-containing protein [Bradyrhizobium shewense]